VSFPPRAEAPTNHTIPERMAPDSPPHDDSRKTTARSRARQRRRLAAQRHQHAGAALRDHYIHHLGARPGHTVAGYWPMGDELDPRPLMEALAHRGVHVALPAVAEREAPLTFRRWWPGQPLEPGPHGTAHPPEREQAVTPDILLVPLLAFDDAGYRLGYGGGYYDRTLAALEGCGHPVLAVGVAYSDQRDPTLPREAHDRPLDWLVTESGARRLPRAGQPVREGA